jgi:hypothetical protein
MAACPDAAREAIGKIGAKDKTLVLFDRSNHHLLWDHDGPEAQERIVEFVSTGSGGSR